MKTPCDNSLPILETVHSQLIELVREGVLIVSQQLVPVYLNLKAREICQLLHDGYPSTQLPHILVQISQRLLNNLGDQIKPLTLDHQVDSELTIRIRVWQFPYLSAQESTISDRDRNYLLIFLEDRNVTLSEEIKIEQKKYDLTDREAEILRLLLQTCSYQEIASKLQISLNTVKFHVKNINSKKRSQPDEKKYLS